MTSSTHGERRYLAYAYTEQGVALLSAAILSKTSKQVSIQINNAFYEIRRRLLDHALLFQRNQFLLKLNELKTLISYFCIGGFKNRNMGIAQLSTKISALPSELKSEVNDFVDFLLAKRKKQLKKKKPVFGCAKGEIIMSPDFDKPIEDFKDYL